MVPLGPNVLIVRPIWTREPLNAACPNGTRGNVVRRSWWAVHSSLVESLAKSISREFQIGVATSWLPLLV